MHGEGPRQFIQVANQQIPLPEGVTVADWSLEKVRVQNPRIRAFLGCIRLLNGVLESNYAILHCSPERLREIWRKVRQVSHLVRTRVEPLLGQASVVPAVEATRRGALDALALLDREALQPLDRFPEAVPTEQILEVRKLLCVSIGKIHAFLQDTFGELMASDPRSLHDADYFLSQRFPQDIEEAEWLHSTVARLDRYVDGIEERRRARLEPFLADLDRDRRLPERERWGPIHELLVDCAEGLTPKLQETLALRGIRFYEMEILDRYAMELPARCRIAQEIFSCGREIADGAGDRAAPGAEPASGLPTHVHAVAARRLAHVLREIDSSLRDLRAFLPLWLEGIERRRALLLKRGGEDLATPEDPLDDFV